MPFIGSRLQCVVILTTTGVDKYPFPKPLLYNTTVPSTGSRLRCIANDSQPGIDIRSFLEQLLDDATLGVRDEG